MPERDVTLVLKESEARQIIADPATAPLVLRAALQRAFDAQAAVDKMAADWASAKTSAARCVACGTEVRDPRLVRYLRSTALGRFVEVARACRERCGKPERWRALVGADEAEAGRLIAAWAAPKERDANA